VDFLVVKIVDVVLEYPVIPITPDPAAGNRDHKYRVRGPGRNHLFVN
jgi:hypothetical protein